jgi:L-ascorbate metabolism protein UlaG (beta-lactamase superfamily)
MVIHRRQFLRSFQGSLILSLGLGLTEHWADIPAILLREASANAAGGITLRYLGHTCFQITGNGIRVLINPFRPVSCTAKYKAPKVPTDLVFISSKLLDEGFLEGLPGKPKLLAQAGTYRTNGLEIQGISTFHDRVQGQRFGTNVAWKWKQGGLTILHLGGIASPIGVEQKILMGQPDILLIPVGGSDKAYNPEEANAAIATLQPKLVIPTHYKTAAADPATCTLQPVEDFLKVMGSTPVQKVGSTLTLSPGQLPKSTAIRVMNYA